MIPFTSKGNWRISKRRYRENRMANPPALKYSVKYLGGHSSYSNQSNGSLFVLGEPQNKVIFESPNFKFDILAEKLKDVKITSGKYLDPGMALMIGVAALLVKSEQKALLIQFEDSHGIQQTPTFQFNVSTKRELETLPEQAYANINNLFANAKKNMVLLQPEQRSSNEKATTFFCKYCGFKNDLDALWCESCGKKVRGEAQSNLPEEKLCATCGTKNKVQASFCKKCGYPLSQSVGR